MHDKNSIVCDKSKKVVIPAGFKRKSIGFNHREDRMARIMIVDDEESIRGIFSAFLTRLGHEVAEAESGPLALAQL